MPAAPAIAAFCFVLAVLIGERGLARSPRFHDAARGTHGLVRLQIGALLIAAMSAAAASLAFPAMAPALSVLPGLAAGGGALWLLARRQGMARTPLARILAIFALLHADVALLADTAAGWLLAAFGVILAFALGLPAFIDLVRRMDDRAVPAFMRPLPARVLAAGIIALAAGSLASW
ncbi:MAG: hypothetical protein AB7D30_08905 [Lysobacteraceae bacterium]